MNFFFAFFFSLTTHAQVISYSSGKTTISFAKGGLAKKEFDSFLITTKIDGGFSYKNYRCEKDICFLSEYKLRQGKDFKWTVEAPHFLSQKTAQNAAIVDGDQIKVSSFKTSDRNKKGGTNKLTVTFFPNGSSWKTDFLDPQGAIVFQTTSIFSVSTKVAMDAGIKSREIRDQLTFAREKTTTSPAVKRP